MFCSSCGTQNSDNARFCRGCGKPLTTGTGGGGSITGSDVLQTGYNVAQKLRPFLPLLGAIALVLVIGTAGVKLISSVVSGSPILSGPTIVGSWSSSSGEVLKFEKDNTCSIPFTYDGGWLESCDRYSVLDDDMLVLSSSKGNIRSRRYTLTKSKETALEDSSYYYLSKKELVVNKTLYKR